MAQEPDDSEDIMCSSMVDKYSTRHHVFEDICLAEDVTFYTMGSKKAKRRKKPYVIRYVRYNEHIDPNNYHREKLMLFIPYRGIEDTLKESHRTWLESYLAHRIEIEKNEALFTAKTKPKWGDIDIAASSIESIPAPMFDINFSMVENTASDDHEKYDVQHDLFHAKHSIPFEPMMQKHFELTKQPFLLDTCQYFSIRK